MKTINHIQSLIPVASPEVKHLDAHWEAQHQNRLKTKHLLCLSSPLKKGVLLKKDPCRTYNVPNLHEIPMYKKLRDIRPKSLYLKSHVAKILFSCYVVGFCLLPKHLLK